MSFELGPVQQSLDLGQSSTITMSSEKGSHLQWMTPVNVTVCLIDEFYPEVTQLPENCT